MDDRVIYIYLFMYFMLVSIAVFVTRIHVCLSQASFNDKSIISLGMLYIWIFSILFAILVTKHR
jgi:uncharacterized membrane protein